MKKLINDPRAVVREMLEPNAAETQCEAHQIREAQLRARGVVPSRCGVLGGDAIGFDIDPDNFPRRNRLFIA